MVGWWVGGVPLDCLGWDRVRWVGQWARGLVGRWIADVWMAGWLGGLVEGVGVE